MTQEQEKLNPVIELFNRYLKENLTEDLEAEFKELGTKQPLENCYLILPIHTKSADHVDYWKVIPGINEKGSTTELTPRLKDYMLLQFEKAKNDV